jgi:thymidylate synthase
LERYKVKDIRNEIKIKYDLKQYTKDKSGVNTIEIVNCTFLADEPVIFGTINEDYIKREIEWYDSKSLNVFDIPGGTPQIWKDVSDSTGMINSNYGYLIYSAQNYFQYDNCLNELEKNPDSRRAVMIYNRPSIWNEYNLDGMSDFICTFSTQHFNRNNSLETIVNMRSSDIIFGYRNDFAWFNTVHNRLANDLGIKPGSIFWNAGSAHIYERHFYLIGE